MLLVIVGLGALSAQAVTVACAGTGVQSKQSSCGSSSPASSAPLAATGGLLSRRDLIYGSEIGCWEVDGGRAVNPSTGIPRKIIAARIPVIRFAVYDVFTDMTDPNGAPGTLRRADFDHAIRGITTTLRAVPWIKLLPVAREAIDTKPGTVFVPPLNNLGRDLGIHKAILAEVRKVYGGPIIIESDNEGEYASWRKWGFKSDGGVGVSKALGDKYVATMPALKKYARDVLGFSQVVTVGYVGVPGGPGWGQDVTPDASKPYGYACDYESRWIDEFNTQIHAAYTAHGNDPDYIPDVESVHAYPHGPDFSSRTGYEFSDRMVYAYFRSWLTHSRGRLKAIWGPTVGARIRFSISEWNAGANNEGGTWSGWRTPARVQSFYKGWLRMLQGNGRTTGSRHALLERQRVRAGLGGPDGLRRLLQPDPQGRQRRRPGTARSRRSREATRAARRAREGAHRQRVAAAGT